MLVLLAAILALSLYGNLANPSLNTGSGPSRSSFATPVGVPVDNVSVGNQTIGNLAPIWGVDLRPEYAVGAGLTGEVQGTPIDYFRWPGGAIADRFNMSTGAVYAPSSVAPTNETAFVDWCRSTGCHAILQVPGEINSPSTAAWEVAYTELQLGFHPDYWEIGNEPGLWTHFNIPWAQWTSSQSSTASPQTYAATVQQYVAAMRAVDPFIRIIGLPGVGLGASSETQWISSTVALNGPNLSAVAIHVYPAGQGPATPTLPQFFATLNGRGSIPVRIAGDRQAIRTACPSCGPIEVFVTELGSGSAGGGSWQTYMAGYPNVPYIAAELSQAVSNQIFSAELFALQGTYAGSIFDHSGIPHPIDRLYTDLLPHLGPIALATEVGGPAHGVYAIGSKAANSSSVAVMVVNANASASVDVRLGGSGFPSTGSFSFWSWNSSTPGVLSGNGTGDATSWSLPPLGLLVVSVETTGTGSGGGSPLYPITFRENGLPVGTSWSVNLSGNVPAGASTTSSVVSFEEPNGSYGFAMGNLSGFRATPARGSLVVNGSAVSETVEFVATSSGNHSGNQNVTFEETGLPNGMTWGITIGGNGLGSSSSSFVVSEPNGTYSYTVDTVPGWGPSHGLGGKYAIDGNPRTISVPFVRGIATTFITDGIGEPPRSNGSTPGAAWLLQIDNATFTVGAGNLTLSLPPGSYAFNVTPPAGYVAFSSSGSVAVSGVPARVVTEFTPVSAAIHARFDENGLTSGTQWSVTILGFTVASNSSSIELSVTGNENYSFQVQSTPGYSALPSSGFVDVKGQNLTIFIAFSAHMLPGTSPPLPTGALLMAGAVAGFLLARLAATQNHSWRFFRRQDDIHSP